MNVPKKADWFVEAVEAHRDYTLHLTFADGRKRVYDARELLSEKLFAPLKDVEFFLRAHRAGHSVAWSEEVDIAPEYLYDNSTLA